MWLKDGGCFRKSWSSAFTTISDFNNNPGKYPCRYYASDYSDWRLPNIKEIESLVNYGVSNSASWINLNGFTNLNSSYYWSSTTYRGSPTRAWVVDMKAGTSKVFEQILYLLCFTGARSWDLTNINNQNKKGSIVALTASIRKQNPQLIPFVYNVAA